MVTNLLVLHSKPAPFANLLNERLKVSIFMLMAFHSL